MHGDAHVLGALNRWQALVLMAPLAWLGAAVASHAVEHAVAGRLTVPNLGLGAEIGVVGLAVGFGVARLVVVLAGNGALA